MCDQLVLPGPVQWEPPLSQQEQVNTACSGLSFILVITGLNFSLWGMLHLRFKLLKSVMLVKLVKLVKIVKFVVLVIRPK